MGVLALQGAVSEHAAALRRCGAEVVEVRTRAELDRVDALVLPGGESTTVGLLLHKQGLLEPLRARIIAGMPTWGTCMGMILLARRITDGVPDQPLLGCMDITVRRNAFGRQVDSCVCPLPLSFDAEPFPGVFIRAPEVLGVGEGVEVLARRPDAQGAPSEGLPGDGEGRVVAVRERHMLGTSFHPELTADLRLHRYFLDMAREALLESRKQAKEEAP